MADAAATTATGAKRKRAPFTRTEKPVFAIVRATDAEGNVIALKKENVSITLEKDSAKIVDLVTSGDMGGAIVARVQMPAAPKKPAAPAAS